MGQSSLINSDGYGFFGYADNNTTYGYYNVTFNYTSIIRHGNNISVTDAYIKMANPNTGYTTNYVYVDKVLVNTQDVGISGSAYGGSSKHTWQTTAKDISFTVSSNSARVITVKMYGHRTGQNASTQLLSGTFEIPPIYTLTINPNGGKINNGDTTGQTTSFTTKFLYGVKTYMGNLTSSGGIVNNTPTRTGYAFNNFTFNHGSGGLNSSGDTFYFNGEGPGSGYSTNPNFYVFNGDYIGNVTATAQWTANTYTVKYNGNGNTGGSTTSSTHTYDTSKTLTSNGFTKTGYTFKNWNTKADGSGTSYSNGASVKNLTTTSGGTVNLYAQWTPNTYTIAFNANGGSGTMSNITMTFDAVNSTAITNNFTRTGYTFAGWSITGMTDDVTHYRGGNSSVGTSFTGTSYAGPSTSKYFKNLRSSSGTVTFTAQWTANSYTVTFNANGGSVSTSSKSVTYDSTYGTLPTPTRDNYRFDGWYTEASGGTRVQSTDTVKITSSITLYAHWTALYYLDLNTYINGVNNTTETAITADVYIGGSKVATGVSDYWSQHPAGTTYEIKNIIIKSGFTKLNVTGASGTLNFTKACVVYVGRNYTVTYKANGGIGSDQTQAINYGTVWTTKSSSTFSRTGYTFSGWNTAANGSGTSYTASTNQSSTTTSNITLYAHWTANNYIITFNANGGALPSDLTSLTVKYDSSNYWSWGTMANTTKLGFSLKGYYDAASGGNKIYNADGTCYAGGVYWDSNNKWKYLGNVTAYAQWEPWGVVRIYTDKGWQLAVPYIYDNGWKQTFPYIYDNGWKECH